MPISQGELSRRIRSAREACRLTQEQVAEHLGVSRPTVAQLEAGNRSVSSLELDRLAHLFGRDVQGVFPYIGKDRLRTAVDYHVGRRHEGQRWYDDFIAWANVQRSQH